MELRLGLAWQQLSKSNTSLHYFVNILVNSDSNINILFILHQPLEQAIEKCPQLYQRILQKLRNGQNFFLYTLYLLVAKYQTTVPHLKSNQLVIANDVCFQYLKFVLPSIQSCVLSSAYCCFLPHPYYLQSVMPDIFQMCVA